MPDCPLADECPSYSERIQGMGCQHYGDRGGAEWCQHYSQPIRDLKEQPVQRGQEVVVTVEDIHESGAGVGRTEDGATDEAAAETDDDGGADTKDDPRLGSRDNFWGN